MVIECSNCGKDFKQKYRANKYCSITCSNRSNLNNKRVARLPSGYSKELAELFGILLGDGSVTKYYVKVYLNLVADLGYVPYVVRLCKYLFKGVSVTAIKRPSRGTYEIQISSKDVCDYLLQLGFDPKVRDVPLWIRENRSYSVITVRGLVDTEGSVGFKYFDGVRSNSLYKQLTFTNKNTYILKFVEEVLTSLGYKPTKGSSKNIYLSNKRDVQKYLFEVGSSNPKLVKKIKLGSIHGYSYQGKASLGRRRRG